MRHLVKFAIGLSSLQLAIAAAEATDEQTPFTRLEQKLQQPYGFWESPVTPEWIANQSNTIEDVFVDKVTHRIYYIERQAEKGGRNMIKDYVTNEPVFDGPYDARTRVHEYGGGQSFAHNGTIYFSNYLDDMLYEIKPGEKTPVPLTGGKERPDVPRRCYADFDVHPIHSRIIVGVVEVHGETVENLITVIDTKTKEESVIDNVFRRGEHDLLGRPPDFVDNPRFSPDGKRLAFRAWFHPYMSWEASELWIVEVNIHDRGPRPPTFKMSNPMRIAGDRDHYSVGEPVWFNSTALVFTSDGNDYNTPWVYNLDLNKGKPLLRTLVPLEEDFSAPAFRLGTSSIAVIDDKYVAYASYRQGRSYFTIFDVLTMSSRSSHLMPFTYATSLRSVSSRKIALLATWDKEQTAVITASFHTVDHPLIGHPEWKSLEWSLDGPDRLSPLLSRYLPICPGLDDHPSSISSTYISCPWMKQQTNTTFMAYARRTFVDPMTGDPIHATYYPPTNLDYESGVSGERPPVVVNMHGGPTDFSHHGLNWDVQLFTSRGFAWVDVNYAGSTHYGRAYRERLLGQWGVVDVRDALTAVRWYGALSMLDPSRAVIRGGGLTVLSALATEPDAFLAGTSIAGISDLGALQAKLPKFESRHLLKYVGGTPEENPELWWDRSPISRAGDIRAPLLMLHGENDPIVPVEQARSMFEAVRNGGGKAELHILEGEGHGWRQATSVRKALELELEWYQTVLTRPSRM